MTANVNIKRGDLHLAVSAALYRGRYVLTTAGGDGAALEVTVDLRERPDDLFGEKEVQPFDWVDNSSPGRLNAAGPCFDDHGAAIPAQGKHYREAVETGVERGADGHGWRTYEAGPRVYEFALQDIRERPIYAESGLDITLANAELCDAPDIEAIDSADYVHVYDRVTRERRTLKRPEPDAVLTGLRDVAADLRTCSMCGGTGLVEGEWQNGGPSWETCPKCGGKKRGDPVEPPFGCAALPPVGPLTSTEGLKPGDVLNIGGQGGDLVRFEEVIADGEAYAGELRVTLIESGSAGINHAHTFAFVGRPDADGWMAWGGGENPVPGAWVVFQTKDGADREHCQSAIASESLDWSPPRPGLSHIVAFRIVDTPPAV